VTGLLLRSSLPVPIISDPSPCKSPPWSSALSSSQLSSRYQALQDTSSGIASLHDGTLLSICNMGGSLRCHCCLSRAHFICISSDGVPPYAHFPVSNLHPQQPYEVSLHLVVPATESNLALGNFMASLRLSTPSNKTLVSVRRPVCRIDLPLRPMLTQSSRRLL